LKDEAMMNYKTIVVHLDRDARRAERLDLAFGIPTRPAIP